MRAALSWPPPSDTINRMNLSDIQMNVHADCFPCFLRQANLALSAAGAETSLWRKVLKAVLTDMAEADFDKTPAHTSTRMHRRIRRMLGRDPFAALKLKYNNMALALLPSMKDTVRASADPLMTAARMAIAGNIIDFGIFRSVDIEGTVRRALTETFATDHGGHFTEALNDCAEVLYLLDNTGEIVFDMLLIEEIQRLGRTVTAVVRGGPILNDCTTEDARHVGLNSICHVIDNGSDFVGTVLEEAHEDFLQRFHRPNALIISKGQGNFETLLNLPQNIFYLFQAKCDVVAGAMGIEKGSMLLMSNQGGGHIDSQQGGLTP